MQNPETPMRTFDHDTLKHRAQALRSAELRRIVCAAEVKWMTFLRRSALRLPKDPPNAPLPCQVPAPSHP